MTPTKKVKADKKNLPSSRRSSAEGGISQKPTEIRELIDAINALNEQVKKNAPKRGWKRFFLQFSLGVFQGVGLVIGSVIIASIALLMLQKVLMSPAFQQTVSNAVTDVLQQAISSGIGL
ncbi:MAG: DUF5665 domain-containing protein [Patescibacteria group bacterium]